MPPMPHKLILQAIVLVGMALLTACPQEGADDQAAPPVKIRQNTANTNANGEQLVDKNLQINKPSEDDREGEK